MHHDDKYMACLILGEEGCPQTLALRFTLQGGGGEGEGWGWGMAEDLYGFY